MNRPRRSDRRPPARPARRGAARNGAARNGSARKKWVVGLGLTAALAGVVATGAFSGLSGAEVDNTKYAPQPVKRGPFRVTVREKGELDATESVLLSNQTGEDTTIVSIVPAGTLVKEGDVILELDAEPIEQEKTEDQIDLTTAKAELEKAEQDLEIVRQQNESDIATAELEKTLADLDLTGYIDGEYEQEKQKLEDELAVNREDLSQKREAYEFSKRMAKKGYSALNEMETARIQVNQAQIKVSASEEGIRVLENYTKKRTLAELRENKQETERNLERVKSQTRAAEIQAEAVVEAAKLNYEVQAGRFEKTLRQLAAATIIAPQDGEVVYVEQEGRRGQEQAIEKGATVYPRQDIIKLPDLSRIKVDASIHESQISKISTGLPAVARVEAYPNRQFRGTVTAVSSVPVQGNWLRDDLKEYKATVELDPLGPNDPKLKPGLTCEVEILVEQRQDVLQVPVQSVVNIAGERFVFVLDPAGPRRAEVEIGVNNDTDVEIVAGLEEGQMVVMNPRTHFAGQIDDLEKQLGATAKTLDEDVKSERGNAGGGAKGDRAKGGGTGGETDGGRGADKASERNDADADADAEPVAGASAGGDRAAAGEDAG